MATLKVGYDPLFVYGWCSAVDCLNTDVGVAQRGDLVVLIASQTLYCDGTVKNIPSVLAVEIRRQ
jgi:hypothetical protein